MSYLKCLIAMFALCAGLVLAAVSSQTPGAAGAATQPATAPAGPISQPAQFLALAEKARKLQTVYVKGAATWESLPAATTGSERKLDFEIWAKPPLAKIRVGVPGGEVRVSDGQDVYTILRAPDGQYQGRRRRIAGENFYSAFPVAAVVCDAANGYDNLTGAVRFEPAKGEDRFDEQLKNLEWFQLSPVGGARHSLFRGVKGVKVGIAADDGLIRVLIATGEKDGRQSQSVVRFDVVKTGDVKSDDLLLPPEAAAAKWRDSQTDQPIAAPAKLIAKPEK